jgi:hypothetical protein
MTSTARFVVTVSLAWAIFLAWVAIAHAAPQVHGCTGMPPAVAAAFAVAAASVGCCLGFLAAALLRAGSEGER